MKPVQRFTCPGENFYVMSWTEMQTRAGQLTAKASHVLAAGGLTGDIQLIDYEQMVAFRLGGHSTYLTAIEFHPTQRSWLLSADVQGRVLLRNIALPDPDKSVLLSQFDAVGDATAASFTQRPFGGVGVAVGDNEGRIQVWDVATNTGVSKCAYKLNGKTSPHASLVDNIVCLGDDTYVSRGMDEGRLTVWQAVGAGSSRKVAVKAHLSWPKSDTYGMLLHAFPQSDGGAVVAAGCPNGEIFLYHVPAAHLSSSSSSSSSSKKVPTLAPVRTITDVAKEYPTPVRQVALSADGKYLVAVNDSNLVSVWGH